MTDRGQSALQISDTRLDIGPSSISWQNDHLRIDVNEISTPHGQRIKGVVKIIPSAITTVELALSDDGAHIWRPFAPIARIEVDLGRTGWSWSGHGYFDANFGTRALEKDFTYWTWGRFPTAQGATCFYDATRADGSDLSAAIAFDPSGAVQVIDAPPKAEFARPFWQVRRETRADAGFAPHQVKPMLDAPFYNRSMVKTRLNGQEVTGVHEALDLARFRKNWLMPLLAFRVPRRAHWP